MMRRILQVQAATYAAIIVLAVGLSGCASTLQFAADTFGVDVVSETVKQKAYKAALVTFVAWGGAPDEECKRGTKPADQCIGGIQELIYKYGKLTLCENTTSLICRDQDAWNKIKTIELATTKTLASTEPIILAGTDDVALMMSLPTVVNDAKAAIEAAIKGD